MPPSEMSVQTHARLPQSTNYCSPALAELRDRFFNVMISARGKTTYCNCPNDHVIPVLYQVSPGKRCWGLKSPNIFVLEAESSGRRHDSISFLLLIPGDPSLPATAGTATAKVGMSYTGSERCQ